MGRILGIDYGKKRCGIAVTDPLQIIVTGLCTVETSELNEYLDQYMSTEEVDEIVLGLPSHKDGTPTYLVKDIEKLRVKLINKYPDIHVNTTDEAFSSSEAKSIILQSGVRKKKRRDKELIDKISAVVILQRYLGHI